MFHTKLYPVKIFTKTFGKSICSVTKSSFTLAKTFSSKVEKPIVLGIETSCDDTGIGIVDGSGKVLGEALHSQQLVHLRNGGVIPYLAEEMHIKNITDVCEEALKSANLRLRDVDAIATTVEPGLPLSLAVGLRFGKYLSMKGNKPFIPIHHMKAHALTVRMVEKVEFPYLVLLISGGHSLLAIVEDVDKFHVLGETTDDAPGEAFDKIARRLKLINIPDLSNFSGGEALEIAASRANDPMRYELELPLLHYRDCNFSFSGLKTKMSLLISCKEKEYDVVGDMVIPEVYDLCAAFQLAVTRHLCHRTQRALEFIDKKSFMLKNEHRTLVVSGGVACNNFIAGALSNICSELGYKFVRTPSQLCRDNGLMIAWNGVEKWKAKSEDVLWDRDQIEKVDFRGRAPLGENLRHLVLEENIKIRTHAIKLQVH